MAEEEGRRAGRVRRRIAWTWLALVGGFALWATISYRSFAALLGEWQYRHFGQNLPIATLAVLTLVPGLPALLLLLLRRRRAPETVTDATARLMRKERRLLALLRWASGLSLLAAVATLGWTLTLPVIDGPARPVSSAMVTPGEGHVRLVGRVVTGRVAIYRQNLLLLRRSTSFAPIAADRGPIRYFVEVPDAVTGEATTVGLLKRDALPGAIVRLFEYAGLAVERPHYVLFASRASMLLPYYITAANWLLAALTGFLLLLLQRWRLRRIERRLSPPIPLAVAQA